MRGIPHQPIQYFAFKGMPARAFFIKEGSELQRHIGGGDLHGTNGRTAAASRAVLHHGPQFGKDGRIGPPLVDLRIVDGFDDRPEHHVLVPGMEMVGAFYRFCENNFIDFNDFLGEMSNPYEKVPKMDESTLKKWIVQVSTEMGKQLKSVRNSKSRRLINDAKNIVANRYMEEDLSLDKVCSIMGVSNSYFSSIFKKETGISFVSYLTDYRMDIAAKLILDTNEKSYKIGEMVGYMDANYFSYVFKKKFGISPSKYRNAKLKS